MLDCIERHFILHKSIEEIVRLYEILDQWERETPAIMYGVWVGSTESRRQVVRACALWALGRHVVWLLDTRAAMVSSDFFGMPAKKVGPATDMSILLFPLVELVF